MVYLGETIRYKCQFKDFDETVIEPSSHDIVVTDGDGSEIATTTSPDWDTVDQLAYFDFDIPADGDEDNYKIVWRATHGSNKWVISREFAVEAP